VGVADDGMILLHELEFQPLNLPYPVLEEPLVFGLAHGVVCLGGNIIWRSLSRQHRRERRPATATTAL
jgi:hypothetical protein